MSSARDKLKQRHLAQAERDWELVVPLVEKLLHDDQEVIRELTRRFLTLPSQALWNALGAGAPVLRGFNAPFGLVELLEFVDHFISYQLLDDGTPGVGYFRYDLSDGSVACDASHEGAKPYFHRCVETLRKQDPEAEWLTPERALEILNWHAERDTEYLAFLEERFPEDLPEEPSTEETEAQLLAALAEEL